MKLWLGMLAGMLVIAAGVLIISASLGIALGISFEIAVVFGIVLLVVAAILAYLFYAGVKAQYKRVKTGEEALIGATGIATTDLNPKGEVRVLGEFWQAISKDANIPSGAPIEVVCLEGMFLVVKPAEEKLNSSKCQ
ncbi:MAG: NfeD family protein [Candidatus Bathyarchaeia archaeon]|jgi:membrane-bound serine protease (ClpP class)